VIRGDLEARRTGGRRRWAAWGLAAAAALAGLVVFHPFSTEPAYAAELAQAKRQSASLETTLQNYDPDSRVESGRAAALAAELEDRIAAVDAELTRRNGGGVSGGRDLVSLWQDRVDLMQQLVDVHVTRAAYVGL
jgi:dienelactone hydrolase